MMCRDVHPRRPYLAFLIALIGCAALASLEELLQYFLPYRVGELRDVGLGILGATSGILIYYIGCHSFKKSVEKSATELSSGQQISEENQWKN